MKGRPMVGRIALLLTLLLLWGTTKMAGASPFDHIPQELDAADRAAPQHPMPNVAAVSARDLAGAFRSPLRLPLTPEMIRTPGDPRPYRNGVHQGIDFYGPPIDTPVYPVAAGIVVRVDRDYTPMPKATRDRMLARCREIGGTPGERGVPFDPEFGDVLDRLRGRQVWVYHGRNASGEPVLSVYAHLNGVGDIEVGEFVTRERIVGYVGNSGTSQEGISTTREVHLHLEIYVGEDYWTPREPGEVGRRLPRERDRLLRRATIATLRGEK